MVPPCSSIEEYVQERGRADRDGSQSQAILMYGSSARCVQDMNRTQLCVGSNCCLNISYVILESKCIHCVYVGMCVPIFVSAKNVVIKCILCILVD